MPIMKPSQVGRRATAPGLQMNMLDMARTVNRSPAVSGRRAVFVMSGAVSSGEAPVLLQIVWPRCMTGGPIRSSSCSERSVCTALTQSPAHKAECIPV